VSTSLELSREISPLDFTKQDNFKERKRVSVKALITV